MLRPRSTCSTKQSLPKVSGPRHECITQNLYSLDPPRQINNAFSTVLIFASKLSTVLRLTPIMTKATDKSMESEFCLPWLGMFCSQAKLLRVEMTWRNPACLGTHTLLRSSVSDPVSGLMTKPIHLADHGVITAVLRRAKYPNEPSSLTYGYTLDSCSN